MSVTRVTGSQWLVDYSVTTDKIGDNQVTPEKLDEELNYRVNALDVNDLVQINSDGSIVTRGGISFKDVTGTVDILKIDPVTQVVTTSGDLVVGKNLTVLGTMTYLNSTTLEVADKNITLNKGGTLSTQTGSGLTVFASDGAEGSIIYDETVASKWKAGTVGNEDTVVTENFVQSLTNKTIVDPSNIIDSRVVTFNNLPSGLVAVNVQQAIDALDNIVDNEIVRAINAEDMISENLALEKSRATTAERILQENITEEATIRLSEDTHIKSMLDSEITRATTTENIIQSNLDAEVLRATTAEGVITADLTSEVLRATTAETLLQSNLDVEKARIDSILLASSADLDSFAEIVSLINSVDTVNDTAFASYVTSNNIRATTIETNLSSEILRATTAEGVIQSNLDAEILRATTAEGILETNLSNEISRAISTDTSLNASIIAETTRAKLRENEIQANLDAEILRATTAEGVLQSNIDALTSSTNADLNAEILRATTAEGVIQNALSDEIIRATTKENLIQTNLTNEIIRAVGTETILQNALAVEKARIDSILLASSADLNSFAEIVAYINTVDVTNDDAFASYVVSNDIRVNTLEMDFNSHLASTIAHKSSSITYDPTGTTLISTNVKSALGELSDKIDATSAVPSVINHAFETLATDGVSYFWKPDFGGGVVQGKYVEPFYYDSVRMKHLSHSTDRITFYLSGNTKNPIYMRYTPIVSNVRPFNVLEQLCVVGYEYYESNGLNTNPAVITLRDLQNGAVVDIMNIGVVGTNVTESIVMDTNLLLPVGTRLASLINKVNVTDVVLTLHVKRVYNP